MYFKSYNDLSKCIHKNIHTLPNDINLVVGIPRSGMVPAYMVGLYFNLPVVELSSFINGDTIYGGKRLVNHKEFKKVLIVDDSINTGLQLQLVKEQLKEFTQYNFIFLTVFGTETGLTSCDYCFEIVGKPRAFEWNILNHTTICKHACLDIDGLICEDPTKEENDDSERYIHFLLNAKPKFLPKSKVLSLVTCRLEKYRQETEIWLKRHGVIYKELIMLNLPDQAARVKQGGHSIHKSKHYLENKKAVLFIESSKRQASEIFKLTQKPVFSVEEMIFFQSLETNN